MERSEYLANLKLVQQEVPNWARPSTCKRVIPTKPSLWQRLLNLFK